jgi:CspA family cold shock protein
MSSNGTKRRTGIVRKFDAATGYGFIRPADGHRDVFLHRSEIQGFDGGIADGDRVEFDAPVGSRFDSSSPRAQNVVKLS